MRRCFKCKQTLRLTLLILIYYALDHCTALDLPVQRQYNSISTHIARPKFIVQPESQEVDYGSRVQLKCIGEASPAPMLYWYKEGHRQLMFAPTATQSSSSQAKQAHSDLWPQASALVASSDYRLNSPPQSDISPSINKLFTMPNPDHLSIPNYSNNYFNDRIYVDTQGTLNILNATSSDSGYYACVCISTVGSVMAKAKLTVRRSTSVHSDIESPQDFASPRTSLSTPSSSSSARSKYDLLPPPVIKLGAANQTLPTNTSATLVCEVVSQVAYKIQWFFESQPLQEDIPRVVVLESGALSINNLKTSDSGVYTCVVTAATDQTLSIAAPFEPLDSSMLTSAPPVPQSTSHSTILKVASPLNPNIQFYRMDNFAYPSSPGIAYLVSTNGNDAITIAWAPPADSGSLPIKEYIVEHYDTSQEKGWTVIYTIKGRESLLIDGLSPYGSHFFVIRAANSRGSGPSSPIAGPIRTVAGEALYQTEVTRRRMGHDSRFMNFDSSGSRFDVNVARERLMTVTTNLVSLTPMTSTSIKLHWSVQVNSSSTIDSADFTLQNPMDTENYFEGYSIRFRAIGIGESLLGREPLLNPQWNGWSSMKESSNPASLPLVTSYLDQNEESISRFKRELVQTSYDYAQEFNEVRVADRSSDFYTINNLRPFTIYQFFVVPYYKDVDGVPSNLLTAQTNEDKPSVAPHLIVRPLNTTSVRLLWLHVPPIYANGILRGYVVQINLTAGIDSHGRPSDLDTRSIQANEATKLISLPLGSLNVASLNLLTSDTRVQMAGVQQYVVMYDLNNLTYKSFYAIQVAATTNAGFGPWSDPQNFIMDPKILSQPRSPGNEFDDVMSKSLISTIPQSYTSNSGNSSAYALITILIILLTVVLIVGYTLYHRNNQKVTTWKKTISEHLANKFYVPSNSDHRGPNSLQQNIYDHQQHLIYSGTGHIVPQTLPQQALWTNNGCINSSGTGSLSSHGGLLQINNDPTNLARRMNNEQIMVMSNNDTISKFGKTGVTSLVGTSSDSTRPMGLHSQIIHHGGDYYSVINNVAEYEELDSQHRNNIPLVANADRQLTASSNSDTSCPSSVTRLLPNQKFNRDILANKNFLDNPRQELVLQQQIGYNHPSNQDGPTMIQSEVPGHQTMMALSPYATTNLINQVPMSGNQKHIFANNPSNLSHHIRQQNYMHHGNAGMSMDDSSKSLMNHQQQQQLNGSNNLFRTLQRSPANFQARAQQLQQAQLAQVTSHQVFVGPDAVRLNDQMNSSNQVHGPSLINHGGHMTDIRANLYEHIDYSIDGPANKQHRQPQHSTAIFQNSNNASPRMGAANVVNGIMSSSTSSGSVKSGVQGSSSTELSGVRGRRGSTSLESETHDLRVFAKPAIVPRQQQACEPEEPRKGAEQTHDPSNSDEREEDDDDTQVDETTAFRHKTQDGDTQRSRQLSKRRRQQQRNRLHNNNQKSG